MCVCMDQFLAARGLVAVDDPILKGLGLEHAKALCTTIPRTEHEIIAGHWGHYRQRLQKEKLGGKLDTIKVAEVPGSLHLVSFC